MDKASTTQAFEKPRLWNYRQGLKGKVWVSKATNTKKNSQMYSYNYANSILKARQNVWL